MKSNKSQILEDDFLINTILLCSVVDVDRCFKEVKFI